jgi:PAS domain S-box-containing protein
MSESARILILDDDANLRKTLSDILRIKGFEPVPLETGKEALERIQTEEFAVALIDLRLEDIPGLEVLRAIRQYSPDTECILVTGHASQATAIEAINLGAYSYVQKPFDMDQLSHTIRNAVEKRQTKRSLVESEARYSTFINATSDSVFLKDDQFRYLLVNEANARLFGKPVAEIIGKDDFELMEDRQGQACRESDKKALREHGLVTSIEETDGRFYETHKFPVKLQGGQVGVGGYVRDITEKRQAERALKESEVRYRGLFEDTPISVWEEDFSAVKLRIEELRAQGVKDFRAYFKDHLEVVGELLASIKILDVNNATLKLFHAGSKEELTGSFKRVVGEISIDGFLDEFVHIAEAETDFEWEGINHTMEGETLRVSLHWSAGPGYEETLGRVIVSMIDVTQRKQAEDALHLSEERFRSVFENVSIGIYRTAPDGRILLANPAMCHILGYETFEELAKQNLEQEGFNPEYLRSQFRELIESQGQVVGLESSWKKKDGNTIYVRESARAFHDENGNILYYEGTAEDISERKQTEKTLQTTQNLLTSFLENAPMAGYVITVDDRMSLVNHGWELERHLTREQAIGKRLADLFPAEMAKRLARDNKQVRTTGQPLIVEESVDDTDGQHHYFTVKFPLFNLEGNVEAVGGLSVDISERKQAEKLLAQQTEALRRQNEELTRLNEQAERRMQRLVSMRTIDMAISGSFDMGIVLGIILDQVTGQLGTHAADILLFNPNGQTFKFSSGRGFRTQGLERSQYKFGSDLAWRLIRERHKVEIPDLRAQPSVLQRTPELSGEGFVSYIGVPLMSKGQIQGVLEVFQREPLNRDQEWHSYLDTLAGQAAIAIDNAQLFDHLQSSNTELVMAYDTTLAGWASALELRDKETEGHTRRVASLTTQMAQAMGLGEDEQVQIFRGALLHDIGKMGLPDSIVLKPGPLTEQEWAIMHRHPQYAFDMLAPIAYLRPALDIPHCHHEKWDGTGYPRGLKGENIPLPARLFAVVDVWDALTSDRPYRKAWTEQEAVEYIRQQSGQHFDPAAVKIFLENSNLWKKGG